MWLALGFLVAINSMFFQDFGGLIWGYCNCSPNSGGNGPASPEGFNNCLGRTNPKQKMYAFESGISEPPVLLGVGVFKSDFPSCTGKRFVLKKWFFQISSRWRFQIFFMFIPILWKIAILTHIFQMGWNHQPVMFFTFFNPDLFLGPKFKPIIFLHRVVYNHYSYTFRISSHGFSSHCWERRSKWFQKNPAMRYRVENNLRVQVDS